MISVGMLMLMIVVALMFICVLRHVVILRRLKWWGNRVSGKVVKKFLENEHRDTLRCMKVTYPNALGKKLTKTLNVSKRFYKRYDVGDKVMLFVDAKQPKRAVPVEQYGRAIIRAYVGLVICVIFLWAVAGSMTAVAGQWIGLH